MVIPFSFNNAVHGCFSIQAVASEIETGAGRSAMLTLTFCAEDGDPLKTLDVYFDPKASANPYHIEDAISHAGAEA